MKVNRVYYWALKQPLSVKTFLICSDYIIVGLRFCHFRCYDLIDFTACVSSTILISKTCTSQSERYCSNWWAVCTQFCCFLVTPYYFCRDIQEWINQLTFDTFKLSRDMAWRRLRLVKFFVCPGMVLFPLCSLASVDLAWYGGVD